MALPSHSRTGRYVSRWRFNAVPGTRMLLSVKDAGSAGRALPRRLSILASRRASPGGRWRGFRAALPGARTLLCGPMRHVAITPSVTSVTAGSHARMSARGGMLLKKSGASRSEHGQQDPVSRDGVLTKCFKRFGQRLFNTVGANRYSGIFRPAFWLKIYGRTRNPLNSLPPPTQ